MARLKWTFETIQNYLIENGSELISSKDDFERQLNDGVTPSKVKIDVKCNKCKDGIRYNVCINKYIFSKQQHCKSCTSKILSKNVSNTNKKQWQDTNYRIKRTEEARIQMTGTNNPRWNYSLSDEEREFQRNTLENLELRRKAYERDQYTCKVCGDNRGGNLVVHHLDGWNWAIELRYELNNVITLCETCHNEFHKMYGYGYNTKEEFYDYYNDFIDRLNEAINAICNN